MGTKKYALLLLLLSSSCNDGDGNGGYYIELTNEKFPSKDIFEVVSVYELGDDKTLFSGNIDKLEIFEDKVYVLDRTRQTILIFDLKGNLVSELNKRGRAPNEYTELRDFCIDKESREIAILDYQRILYYNIDTSEYLDNVRFNAKDIDMNPTDFATFGRDCIYILQSANYKKSDQTYLGLFNGMEYSMLRKRHFYYIEPWAERFIPFNSNYILIAPEYGYVILDVTRNGIEEKHKFDFGQYNLPKNRYPVDKNEWDKLSGSNFVTDIAYFKETVNHIFMFVAGPFGYYISVVVIDKLNDQYITGTYDDNMMIPFHCENDDLYSIVSPFEASKNELIKPYIENNDIMGNGYLVRYRLKSAN